MNKEEYFIHHFFTEEEANIVKSELEESLSIESTVRKDVFQGLNSGKEIYTVNIDRITKYENLRLIDRMITLKGLLHYVYSRDEMAIFIADITIDRIYERLTGGNNEDHNHPE